MHIILLYPTLRSIMKSKTKKISITIDEEVLSGIEEMADIKDVSRSKLISRYCKKALDEEQDYKLQKIINKANKNESRKK